jgi:beta-phosphoglucomutase
MELGYIFDMDGVITDTVEHHFRSWKVLADELGLPFSRQDNDQLRGRSRCEALELFLGGRSFPESAREELMARKNVLFLESIQALGPQDLLPGVADLLAEARAEGIHLGLASASHNVQLVCRRLGVLDSFDAVGDGYSVVHPKPAPDIFLWVAGRLGLSPRRCVVFEDAEAGVTAALAGGFYTVGVGPAARLAGAHQVRGSLEGARVGDFLPPAD